MKKFWAVVVLGMSMWTAAASAQQFWDKKNFEDWSRDECKRMLENSPWVGKWDTAEVVFAPVSRQTDMGTEANRQINYLAQIRSALPMRRAVVQMAYLTATRKAPFTPAEKQKMRAQSTGFLDVDFSNYVVVHVTYASNIPEVDRQLARYWQQQTSETVKDSMFLSGSNGKKVAAIHYEVLPGAGREFEVTFPRNIEGAPIVNEADKGLAFEFMHPSINDPQSQQSPQSQRVLMQFKLKEMVSNGKLVY